MPRFPCEFALTLDIFIPYICLIMRCHCSCLDVGGVVFRDEYLINPKLAHLVDDIFWTLGFKSGEQCEKVHRSMIVFSC